LVSLKSSQTFTGLEKTGMIILRGNAAVAFFPLGTFVASAKNLLCEAGAVADQLLARWALVSWAGAADALLFAPRKMSDLCWVDAYQFRLR